MKRLLSLVIFFVGCTTALPEPVTKLPPATFVESTDTALHNLNGTWMMHGEKYSGYIVEKDSGIKTGELPVVDGRENGIAREWYKSGAQKQELCFVNGNREGSSQGWYENGTQSFKYFFHDDKYEGEQDTWFESGHKWQSLHYVKGYEEGKQKSWNDSGRLIDNFTVKNGKLYGVIGRYDCMSVIKK